MLAWSQLSASTTQLQEETNRERRQRQFDVYNQLNDQYVDFLKLCLEHPTIDCFDAPIPAAQRETREGKTPAELRAEGVVLTALVALLERAYVFYMREVTPKEQMTKLQWPGWEAYARSFRCRPSFNQAWVNVRDEFDTEFATWLDSQTCASSGGGKGDSSTP